MRILVVEDYDDVRSGLALTFEKEGHTVMQAADGREAVEVFEREASEGRTFDLGLLDYNLPHFKGDIVAQRIKECADRHHVNSPRFIALTGSEDAHVLGRLKNAGVLEIVIKGGRTFDSFEALRNRIIGQVRRVGA